MSGLRIGVLGASRIAELAIVAPAATLGHRIVAGSRYGATTTMPPSSVAWCPHADRNPRTVSIDAADISVGHAFPPQERKGTQ